jgi:uncharacterized protein
MLSRYAWAAHMMALGLCPPTDYDPGGRWRQTWGQRLARLAGGPSHAMNWQAHPDRDAYWQDRVVDAGAIEVPAMLIGGWADMFKDAMTSAFSALTGPKKLVMGPLMHVLPHLSGVQPYDWVSEMADWWDAHLGSRTVPAGRPEPEAVLFFAQGEGWRAARQWPPEGGRSLALFLAGHGLAAAPPAAAGRRDYQGDAGVGVASGMWDPFGTGHGWPEEQSGDDARSLTFTSEPLPGPVLLAGSPEAELYLAVRSGADAQLTVRLCAVDADGRSALITAGWQRVSAGGSAVPVKIRLGTAAVALAAGARLRLGVACADFPRIWPSAVSPAISLSFGAGQASVLRLPVGDPGRRGDAPAAIPVPPAGPDPGWVTDGAPRYLVRHDQAAGELAVSFGAGMRLRAPSGAVMTTDERFTARVRPGRPDGAALTARIGISVRLPGGERVEVAVRSVSSRTTTVVEGRVVLDGASLLRHTWTNAGT